MRHKIISISTAKAKLLEISRKVNDDGEAFILTKDGNPIGAIVPMEDYEALLETSDIFADHETMKNLQNALKEEKKGKLWKRDKAGKWTPAKRSKKTA